MSYSDQFLRALGELGEAGRAYRSISKKTGIPVDRLKYYNKKNIIPSGKDLQALHDAYNISELYFQIAMGHLDMNALEVIQQNADEVFSLLSSLKKDSHVSTSKTKLDSVLKTKHGTLYQGDCIDVARNITSDSVDMIFANPPFNLDKLYPSKMDDNLKEEEYLKWTQSWLSECIRILKPGGSLFLWNLPVWNSKISSFLHGRLNFRHWIATDIKYSLPIQGRLYPSHYSLMYFVKGEKPNYFSPDRLPAQVCPKCYSDLKDYGGYKNKMNPLGVSLTDVWFDIPPVRHKKYKKRDGSNELSIKLLDRIIEMSTKEGDLVFDPFGGSGTTYAVSEIKKRNWIGSEIDSCEIIKERFINIDMERDYLNEIRSKINSLFPDFIKKQRESRGLWTDETFSKQEVKLEKKASEQFGFFDEEK